MNWIHFLCIWAGAATGAAAVAGLWIRQLLADRWVDDGDDGGDDGEPAPAPNRWDWSETTRRN